jgi:hypothetical protein
MATLLKVLNNLADIKSAGGVALRVRTQAASVPWHGAPVGELRPEHEEQVSLRHSGDRESGAEGVIIAQGANIGGWSLYAKSGKLKYCYNVAGVNHYFVESAQKLAAGERQVRMEFAYAGGGLGEGGQVTLYVDGNKIGEGTIPMTFCGPRDGRWGPLPGRSVGRKPPSPGSCSGTLSPRVDIRRFTPPEPINCAGGVKRFSNERPLCVCSWVIGSPRDGRPNRSPVGWPVLVLHERKSRVTLEPRTTRL